MPICLFLFDTMKTHVKFNISTLKNYELITRKPYTSINSNDIDTLIILLYCSTSYIDSFTLEVFADTIKANQKLLNSLIQDLIKQITINNQFLVNDASDEEGAEVYINHIIPILTKECNLSIDYVLNEMKLGELQYYLSYTDKAFKKEMEIQRLFCFMGAIPHLDTKKIKAPNDFIPFDWDNQQPITNALEGMTVEALDEILNSRTLNN